MKDYAKQEAAIFGDDDEQNRKKKRKPGKKDHLPKTAGGYQDSGKRSYDNADDIKVNFKRDKTHTAFDAAKIDFKREKNLANRVLTQGEGKKEHRATEMQAKRERQRKGDNKVFTAHQADVTKDLERGELFQGRIRFNPKFRNRAYVTVTGIKLDVLVEGQRNFNRSMDGDLVALRLD